MNRNVKKKTESEIEISQFRKKASENDVIESDRLENTLQH